jgi:hypothetical protein
MLFLSSMPAPIQQADDTILALADALSPATMAAAPQPLS